MPHPDSDVAARESNQATTRIWSESTHNVPAAISKCEVTAAAALAETSPIELDDIAYLVDEQRVVRQPERLATVWLQAECRPHPADRGVGKASLCRH